MSESDSEWDPIESSGSESSSEEEEEAQDTLGPLRDESEWETEDESEYVVPQERGEEDDGQPEQWYTPPQHRRFFRWNETSGLEEESAPFGFVGTSRDLSEPSGSGLQPPRPHQLPQPPPVRRRRQESLINDDNGAVRTPYVYRERTPFHVEQFRDPRTGYPNFQRMANYSRAHPLRNWQSRAVARELADRNRALALDTYKWGWDRTGRKQQLLMSRGFRYNPDTKRFEKDQPDFIPEEASLVPRRQSDVLALNDPRFNRPMDDMGERVRGKYLPVGRMHMGRLDPNYRDRFDTLDYPLQYTPRQREFLRKLDEMSDHDFRLYERFRNQADPDYIDNSMLKRAHSPLRPHDVEQINRHYAKKLMRESQDNWVYGRNRSQRRMEFRRRAQLPVSRRYRATVHIPRSTSESPEIWRKRKKKITKPIRSLTKRFNKLFKK